MQLVALRVVERKMAADAEEEEEDTAAGDAAAGTAEAEGRPGWEDIRAADGAAAAGSAGAAAAAGTAADTAGAAAADTAAVDSAAGAGHRMPGAEEGQCTLGPAQQRIAPPAAAPAAEGHTGRRPTVPPGGPSLLLPAFAPRTWAGARRGCSGQTGTWGCLSRR